MGEQLSAEIERLKMRIGELEHAIVEAHHSLMHAAAALDVPVEADPE